MTQNLKGMGASFQGSRNVDPYTGFNPSSGFFDPRGSTKNPPSWKRRVHCLYHGETFHLRNKCYSCNYFISFIQRVA